MLSDEGQKALKVENNPSTETALSETEEFTASEERRNELEAVASIIGKGPEELLSFVRINSKGD